MITPTLALVWKFFSVFLVLVAVIDLLTMPTSRKVKVYRRQGYTQKAIAARLGVSVYQVRKALA